MRLWTLHPRYLDAKGLVAAWREGLLAQKVLQGATRGYRNHPQLERFRRHAQPGAIVAAYLEGLRAEGSPGAIASTHRRSPLRIAALEETEGQLLFEREHLLASAAAPRGSGAEFAVVICGRVNSSNNRGKFST